MVDGENGGILFWSRVRVNYNGPWARDVDEDDEEDWFGLHDDEDDAHDAMSVYLHTGKLQVRKPRTAGAEDGRG